MTTPTYWRRPCFGVAETAEMIGQSEDGLRAHIARNPLDEFAGEKTGGRLWLSGRDGYFYQLVHTLAAFGVPVRTAMYTAGAIAEYGPPTYDYLAVRTGGGKTEFESSATLPALDGPALVLPLRELYERHLQTCRDYHTRETA